MRGRLLVKIQKIIRQICFAQADAVDQFDQISHAPDGSGVSRTGNDQSVGGKQCQLRVICQTGVAINEKSCRSLFFFGFEFKRFNQINKERLAFQAPLMGELAMWLMMREHKSKSMSPDSRYKLLGILALTEWAFTK